MKPYQPPAKTILPWLKANLGPRCLDGLTGTDYPALRAAVQVAELYSKTSNYETAQAFRYCVMQMQRNYWHLAYHSIAHVMDWSHRAELWAHAQLPVITPGRCKAEP